MRFLLDQDVYHPTAVFLASLGHDVVRAAEVGLSTAPDEEVLRAARSLERILATRDKGFGALIYARTGESGGAILLWMEPRTAHRVHDELARCLRDHEDLDWPAYVVTVEPFRHRLRRVR